MIAPRLRLYLWGPVRAINEHGQSVLPAGDRAKALLCLIGLERSQKLRRTAAAALLWSFKHKEAADNSLRQALHELKLALQVCGQPSIMLTKRGTLSFLPGSTWVDILERDDDPLPATDRSANDAGQLCRDLHGLSPALDAHLRRSWVDLGLRNGHRLIDAGPDYGPAIEAGSSLAPPVLVTEDTGRGGSTLALMETGPSLLDTPFDPLSRFPPPIGSDARIPAYQLGWKMAVLPFRSLGSPTGHGIGLGMAEEVSAALGRFRTPRLTATATFWDGVGPSLDALGQCRTYGLDYVIDGTIQVNNGRIRVSVTLLDVVLDFEVIWSARFDGAFDDLFSLQNRIASETVAQVDPELFDRHRAPIAIARTDVAEAHQAVLTAIRDLHRLDRLKFTRARELLLEAIALDPDYAGAHAWLAYWSIVAVGQGWVENPHEVTELAGIAAERAVALDPLDARGLAIAGHVKGYLLHDVQGALALHAKATELNPNLPIAWALSSWSKIYNGDHGSAIRDALIAQTLSPRDPHIFIVEHALTTAYFFRKRLHDAENLAEVVLARNPTHASALYIKLAILGHLRRHEEAARDLEILRRSDPGVSLSSILARASLQAEDKDFYWEGLRLAGVPEI